MNFETIIEEQKRKSAVINNLIIDFQYLVELTPQIFAKNAETAPEFKNACNFLRVLCDKVALETEQLKTILPVFNEDN